MDRRLHAPIMHARPISLARVVDWLPRLWRAQLIRRERGILAVGVCGHPLPRYELTEGRWVGEEREQGILRPCPTATLMSAPARSHRLDTTTRRSQDKRSDQAQTTHKASSFFDQTSIKMGGCDSCSNSNCSCTKGSCTCVRFPSPPLSHLQSVLYH